MSIVRAILIAFIALSVAMPPLAGAKAYAHSPPGLSAAAQSDCCPDMDHCDKQAKGHCAGPRRLRAEMLESIRRYVDAVWICAPPIARA